MLGVYVDGVYTIGGWCTGCARVVYTVSGVVY